EDTKILRKFGFAQSCSTASQAWSDKVAGLVLQEGHLEAKFSAEFITDITNGSDGLLDARGHTLIALRPHGVTWPIDNGSRAISVSPRLVDGAQMSRESISGTTAFLPDHSSDSQVRQGRLRVCGGDATVVPVLDLAGKDTGVRFS